MKNRTDITLSSCNEKINLRADFVGDFVTYFSKINLSFKLSCYKKFI